MVLGYYKTSSNNICILVCFFRRTAFWRKYPPGLPSELLLPSAQASFLQQSFRQRVLRRPFFRLWVFPFSASRCRSRCALLSLQRCVSAVRRKEPPARYAGAFPPDHGSGRSPPGAFVLFPYCSSWGTGIIFCSGSPQYRKSALWNSNAPWCAVSGTSAPGVLHRPADR